MILKYIDYIFFASIVLAYALSIYANQYDAAFWQSICALILGIEIRYKISLIRLIEIQEEIIKHYRKENEISR